MEDHLGDSVSVAEIDEEKSPVVPPGVHPAVEGDLCAAFIFSQFPTGVSAFEFGEICCHGLVSAVVFLLSNSGNLKVSATK